jgi:hypothetical protein
VRLHIRCSTGDRRRRHGRARATQAVPGNKNGSFRCASSAWTRRRWRCCRGVAGVSPSARICGGNVRLNEEKKRTEARKEAGMSGGCAWVPGRRRRAWNGRRWSSAARIDEVLRWPWQTSVKMATRMRLLSSIPGTRRKRGRRRFSGCHQLHAEQSETTGRH